MYRKGYVKPDGNGMTGGHWWSRDIEATKDVEGRPLDESQFQGGIWLDYLDPIPLTPEILEKNGFKRIEGYRLYPKPRWFFAQDGSRDGVVIEINFYEQSVNGVNILTKINTQSSKDGGVNIIHNCDIEYVHHLQHALRLCRIEKEIQI